jgi:hypothetical protein
MTRLSISLVALLFHACTAPERSYDTAAAAKSEAGPAAPKPVGQSVPDPAEQIRQEDQEPVSGRGGHVPQRRQLPAETGLVAAPVDLVAPSRADVALRDGFKARPTDIALAQKIRAAGWVYVMPRPKSAKAAWGVRDGRTTWWVGYWANATTGSSSMTQPAEDGGWAGDGRSGDGAWRRGGSPPPPTPIEWLCSNSGGVPPR